MFMQLSNHEDYNYSDTFQELQLKLILNIRKGKNMISGTMA